MADEEAVQFDLDDATRFVLSDPRARRFLWWVLENCHLSASGLIRAVLAALDRFTAGQPPADDRTLLVAKVS